MVARQHRTRFSGYPGALKYLNQCVNLEKLRPEAIDPDAFKLDRMRAILSALDNPHKAIRCVHIAGSKGKGSTTEMIASCLAECGYAVGVFTSPHLIDVRERIRIGRQQIAQADFTRIMLKLSSITEQIEAQYGPISYFEHLTAMALAYFRDQAVDLAVIECGLGGRLDSTNVVIPEVCAITQIQLEHTEILGETLEEIAAEKAGIFKQGIPAITVPQNQAVQDVLHEQAVEAGTRLLVLGEDMEFSKRFEADKTLGPHTRVCMTTALSEYEHLAVPLPGAHQAENCGLALAVLDRLRERGYETPEIKVASGLEKTHCHGRMEIFGAKPRILLDGAHTPDSLYALVSAIGSHIRYDSMVVIFGCAGDKKINDMLAAMARGADKIIFTRAKNTPRAADPLDLQKCFSKISPKMTQVARDIVHAFELAGSAVSRDDLVCVTGSFYLVGEARSELLERKKRRDRRG